MANNNRPFKGTVNVNGSETEYFRFGSGKRIFIIVPGLSLKSIMGSAEFVAGAYRRFADEFTVYVFDIKKGLNPGITIFDLAEDIAAAMKQLGIGPACFFGASMGGMIVQCLAISHPEMCERIVIGSSCARSPELLKKTAAEWRAYAEKYDVVSLNRRTFYLLYSDEFIQKNKIALPIIEKEGTHEDCGRFVILSGACESFDVFDRLGEIKCPALVLGSRNDKVMGAEASVEMAEKLGCPIYMYSEYGHAVYDEAPDYKNRLYEFFNA